MFLSSDEGAKPTLVPSEDAKGYMAAMLVVLKGSVSMIAESAAKRICTIGFHRVILKCDTEPAIVDPQRDAKYRRRGVEHIDEEYVSREGQK